MSAVCQLDVGGLTSGLDIGTDDPLCCPGASLCGDDGLLSPFLGNDSSGDSTSTQPLLGLDSSSSQNLHQFCVFDSSGTQSLPVMDAQPLDINFVEGGSANPPQFGDLGIAHVSRQHDAADFQEEAQGPQRMDVAMHIPPQSSSIGGLRTAGPNGSDMPPVLYGVPVDQHHGMQHSQPAVNSNYLLVDMPRGAEAKANSTLYGLGGGLPGMMSQDSAALLEPTFTGMKTGWGAEDAQATMRKVEPGQGSKSRWKPNAQQLCLLEQHFKSGYTKATPELYAAVQGAGPATEAQVSVWLKNRLARCKRQPKGGSQKMEDCEMEGGSPPAGIKREREEEVWEDYSKVQASVFEELSVIMNSIDSSEVTSLARAIRDACHVCCYGVGREGLVMKALAMNLYHLGFDAYTVGDTTAPSVGKGDLFLVSAGPSYYGSVSALSLEAMRAGAKVIAFTAHKTAPLPFADRAIRIASQTLPPCMPVMNRKLGGMSADVVSSLPDGRFSVLQMGASFEISLSVLMECVCIMLRKKLKVHLSEMRSRHTNLE